mmetsp:Transcript_8334/g.20501  ORF Transcript_8334/g.20501 Transcript_8334/m.20501 type:complete len:258 (-) Transcript_8334:840-1613(-)
MSQNGFFGSPFLRFRGPAFDIVVCFLGFLGVDRIGPGSNSPFDVLDIVIVLRGSCGKDGFENRMNDIGNVAARHTGAHELRGRNRRSPGVRVAEYLLGFRLWNYRHYRTHGSLPRLPGSGDGGTNNHSRERSHRSSHWRRHVHGHWQGNSHGWSSHGRRHGLTSRYSPLWWHWHALRRWHHHTLWWHRDNAWRRHTHLWWNESSLRWRHHVRWWCQKCIGDRRNVLWWWWSFESRNGNGFCCRQRFRLFRRSSKARR